MMNRKHKILAFMADESKAKAVLDKYCLGCVIAKQRMRDRAQVVSDKEQITILFRSPGRLDGARRVDRIVVDKMFTECLAWEEIKDTTLLPLLPLNSSVEVI